MIRSIFNTANLVMLGLFLGTLALMKLDPFGFNPLGFEGTSVKPALYILPALVIWFFYFVRPTIKANAAQTPAEKRAVLYEKIGSISRKVMAVLGSFLAFHVVGDIEYLQVLYNVLKTLSENWDIGTQSLETLIGIVLMLASHFYKLTRFASRAMINPRKIEL